MEQYLIDNNVISNYFSGLLSENGMNFIAEVIDQTPIVSVITEIEALSWVNPDKNKELVVKEFLKDATILPLSSDIAKQCVTIRRTIKIKTPDAIIAATAVIHNLTLITSDVDFKKIEGIRVINPLQL